MTVNSGVIIFGTLSIIAFILTFYLSGLTSRINTTLLIVKQTTAVLTQKSLEDEEKERLIQLGVIRLIRHSVLIILISILVFIPSGIILIVGDIIDVAPHTAVFKFLLDWKVFVISIAIMIIVILVRKK